MPMTTKLFLAGPLAFGNIRSACAAARGLTGTGVVGRTSGTQFFAPAGLPPAGVAQQPPLVPTVQAERGGFLFCQSF
jgi:hypothetical protein